MSIHGRWLVRMLHFFDTSFVARLIYVVLSHSMFFHDMLVMM